MIPLLTFALALGAAGPIPIVVPPAASPLERLAASELAAYLAKLYPGNSFAVAANAPATGPAILIGTPRSNPELRQYAPSGAESFVITRAGQRGIVAAANPPGVLYGVYALVEKLGCGFYLSYETVWPRGEPFSFDGWQLSDAPLFADRIVFDWHNFLSSASTWELEDWQHYIAQAAKMRFNTVMVHAYGNNPMFQFRYHGETKPVGYLATTRAGRDWGTQHVNDVRRLIGGEIFREPVFGASVARVAEDQRAEAATALMKKVFAFARGRGMHVTFALDVDTESANPQNIIRTLPESTRLRSGRFDLANPDTPEGYAYFKAQIAQLLETYPEIDRLAVWFRAGATPWRNLQPPDFPPAWRAEFEAALNKAPWLRESKDAPGIFAVSKLVAAAGRALKELGRKDVDLATGSWRLPFLRVADQFMPRDAAIIPLDWNTIFDTAAGQKELRTVRPGRKLIPIVWAHHDDRTYIGRPYTPFVAFSSLLRHSRAAGFGIIHWTTRPLDFYFKSLAAQVWKTTENQGVDEAAGLMAARTFGEPARAPGGEYLFQFVTEAPMFGRETSNRFLDTPLKEPEQTMARIRARLDLLARIGGAASEELAYFRDYEQFMLGFFESHTAWERAVDLHKRGETARAREELARARPEEVIRKYAEAARRGRISRGEEALIISLNLRWRPYLVSLRQALGMEPVRVKFGVTLHEPLAQGAGSNTFFIDEERRLWKTLGEKETGAAASDSGLVVEKPLRLVIAPIMGDRLVPGRYRLELQFAPGGVVEVETGSSKHTTPVFDVEVTTAAPEITLRPVRGTASLAAAVLTPVP